MTGSRSVDNCSITATYRDQGVALPMAARIGHSLRCTAVFLVLLLGQTGTLCGSSTAQCADGDQRCSASAVNLGHEEEPFLTVIYITKRSAPRSVQRSRTSPRAARRRGVLRARALKWVTRAAGRVDMTCSLSRLLSRRRRTTSSSASTILAETATTRREPPRPCAAPDRAPPASRGRPRRRDRAPAADWRAGPRPHAPRAPRQAREYAESLGLPLAAILRSKDKVRGKRFGQCNAINSGLLLARGRFVTVVQDNVRHNPPPFRPPSPLTLPLNPTYGVRDAACPSSTG